MSQELINNWNSQKGRSDILNSRIRKIKQSRSKASSVADKVHNEVFEKMDCLSCANCCKSIPPIVSNRDIKRISSSIGLSPSAFVEQYITIDEDGDQVINASPCPFLQEDNKCKIYDVRPTACRQYPHSGEGAFYLHLSMHKRNAKYCPGLYEIIKRISEV